MIFIQNVVCFILGALCLYLGTTIRQKVDNNKSIQIPTISETLEKNKEKKREKEQANRIQDIMDNVNNYPYNQKEIR